MIEVENVLVQLVDTPSLDREYLEPELFDLIRRADLALLVTDLLQDPLRQLDASLDILEGHRILPVELRPAQPAPASQAAAQPALDHTTALPFIIAVNKFDDQSADELFQICCELLEEEWLLLPVSAHTGRNLERLKLLVFENLGIIRVFAKPPGKEPDLERPFALRRGSTVSDLAASVHRDFYEKLKTARVWGSTAFPGQQVPREYVLQDGDIVELRHQ